MLWGRVVLLCMLAAAVATGQESELEEVHLATAEANNAFSISLYQALSRQRGNLVVSPLSVTTVLSMVWMVASGETAGQLGKGLHLPASHSQVEAGYRQLLTSLQSRVNNSLDIANIMCVQKGFTAMDRLREFFRTNFLSYLVEKDFFGSSETARSKINKLVETNTRKNIKDLIPQGFLDSTTELLLLSAVYFKGSWLKAFRKVDTIYRPFQVACGPKRIVPLMRQIAVFPYVNCPELEIKALKLPYEEESFSMLLILPNSVDGLPGLEAEILSLNLTDIIGNMTETKVDVLVPRFRIENTLILKDVLQQIGITDIFKSPDFFDMDFGKTPVSNVIQKASIEITEEGTLADASAETIIVDNMEYVHPNFVADHPFLFLVLDELSGAIIFMGRMSQPTITSEAEVDNILCDTRHLTFNYHKQ